MLLRCLATHRPTGETELVWRPYYKTWPYVDLRLNGIKGAKVGNSFDRRGFTQKITQSDCEPACLLISQYLK